MPKFKFELPAPIDSATAYKKIKILLNSENEFKRFDPKVACTFDEASKKCFVTGGQFKAELQVKDAEDKSSQISVEVELPLALSLFKGKIKETLEKNLKKILS
ncbi:MAG: polyhydroxyalkanoic acid system family protein [Bdellovibrionaceae bacterium]|nr:polyhydroxyalkanoic acid system family protein [Pseudobdellovibrionaceae bacterium]